VAPVVGAWDANGSYVLVVPERPALLRIVCLLDVGSMAHLLRGSLVCQRPNLSIGRVFCVIPVHGKDVTAEDGTDRPAEPPVFNLPGLSDPVDQGLPSATSSLRVRAQSHSSYSRFQLYVNKGMPSSDLVTLTGFATGRKLNVLAVTTFSSCRWQHGPPWSTDPPARPGQV
jgi:hypothetical protein